TSRARPGQARQQFSTAVLLPMRSMPFFLSPAGGSTQTALRQLQPVAHSVHRLNPARVLRIFFNLAAQAGDVIVHGAGGWKSSIAPDDIQKSLARDRLALRLRQQPEHGKLLGGEMERLFSTGGGLFGEIDSRFPKHHCGWRARLLAS